MVEFQLVSVLIDLWSGVLGRLQLGIAGVFIQQG